MVSWLLKDFETEVLTELHNTQCGGYLSIKKKTFKVRKRFMWYSLKNDVIKWCKNVLCLLHAKVHIKRQEQDSNSIM